MKFSISMLALPMIALGALLKLIAKSKYFIKFCDCRLWSDFLWHRCFAKAMAGFAVHSDLSFLVMTACGHNWFWC